MRKITDVLFVSILLNIIPAALLGIFNISNRLYTILFMISFFAQTLLVVICAILNKIKLDKKDFLLVFLVVMVQLLSNIMGIIMVNNVFYMELLVGVSTTINVTFFIILAKKYEYVSPNDIQELYRRIVIVGIISCLFNLLLNYKGLLSLSFINNSYEAQFSSFFKNRNTYGIFLLVCIIANRYLIINKNPHASKLVSVLFAISLILTMSRTSIVGLIVFYACFLFTNESRRISRKRLLIIFSVICITIASIIIISNNQELYSKLDTLLFRTNSLDDGSGRFDIWENGFRIAMNYSPFFGVGHYNAFWINENIFGNTLQYFHSIYIEMLATYGLFGLAILLYALRSLYRLIKKADKKNQKFLKSTFLCFVVISLFETTTKFSVGYADTISMLSFFTIPILIATIDFRKKKLNTIDASIRTVNHDDVGVKKSDRLMSSSKKRSAV